MELYLKLLFLGLYIRCKQFTFTQIKKIPKFRKRIEKETKEISDFFENEIIENTKSEQYIIKLPLQGIPQDELIKTVDRYLNLGEKYIAFFG